MKARMLRWDYGFELRFGAACDAGAFGRGHPAAAEWFEANLEPSGPCSALHVLPLVCRRGPPCAARWLALHYKLDRKGARPQATYALIEACACGRLETAQWLAGFFAVRARDVTASDALAGAARFGHLAVVTWLVEHFPFKTSDVTQAQRRTDGSSVPEESVLLAACHGPRGLDCMQLLAERFHLGPADLAPTPLKRLCAAAAPVSAQSGLLPWLVDHFGITESVLRSRVSYNEVFEHHDRFPRHDAPLREAGVPYDPVAEICCHAGSDAAVLWLAGRFSPQYAGLLVGLACAFGRLELAQALVQARTGRVALREAWPCIGAACAAVRFKEARWLAEACNADSPTSAVGATSALVLTCSRLNFGRAPKGVESTQAIDTLARWLATTLPTSGKDLQDALLAVATRVFVAFGEKEPPDVLRLLVGLAAFLAKAHGYVTPRMLLAFASKEKEPYRTGLIRISAALDGQAEVGEAELGPKSAACGV